MDSGFSLDVFFLTHFCLGGGRGGSGTSRLDNMMTAVVRAKRCDSCFGFTCFALCSRLLTLLRPSNACQLAAVAVETSGSRFNGRDGASRQNLVCILRKITQFGDVRTKTRDTYSHTLIPRTQPAGKADSRCRRGRNCSF